MTRHVYMSFGGGVQSTALALLAIQRDPRLLAVAPQLPSLYLFADTGDERAATYAHVEKMRELIEASGARFEVLRRDESLSEHVLARMKTGQGGISLPPVYVESAGDRACPVRRGCTSTFKVRLLDSFAREHFREQRRARVPIVQWYGMSHDEPGRLRDARELWRSYAYPLYMMGWTRWHCLQYLAQQTYPDGAPVAAPRSSCVFCPFHSDEEWRSVRADAEAWERACAFDDALRLGAPPAGLKSAAYVHRSRVPLREADLDAAATSQGDLFGVDDHECEGVCGV